MKYSGRCFRAGVSVWLGAALLLAAAGAQAHKLSDSYLTLRVGESSCSGRWDIALRDLDQELDLDRNGDGLLTWGEIKAQRAKIQDYAFSRLRVGADGADGRVIPTGFAFEEHSDGMYAALQFKVEAFRLSKRLEIDYRLFIDSDPSHRGLLRIEGAGLTQTAILGPDAPAREFEIAAPRPGRQFVAFVNEGVWHIWTGYDHILFLLALLLPAVLRRRDDTWEVVGDLKPAVVGVLKIVTAFTVAHSLTLSLAALGWVRLPSRLVESAIAASVVLAAVNNLRPFFHGRGWMVAFAFGLIHGFGFAGALMDLGLNRGSLALALVGFNLGVETGQLAIVGVFLPLAFGLRRSWFYRRAVFLAGSTCVALIASAWMCERLLDLRLLPF
jgi:hypothetical protein